MPNKTPPPASDTADREILLSRAFDAPRELVWKAWTDPKHIGQWWGPRGFTTTTHKWDLKPGGIWRFVMHGPDGTDYENLITYLEVDPPNRLSYKHGGDGDVQPINFHVTVTFEPQGPAGAQTKVTMCMLFPSASAREFVIKTYNALEGGKQNLERLGEYLQTMLAPAAGASGTADRVEGVSGPPFTLTRVIHAPRPLVWKAWTECEHLKRWFGPKGMPLTRCAIGLRPGGIFHYAMKTPDGKEMWGRWVFRKIIAPEQLVVIVSFSDENAGVTRAPFHADWPLETYSVITFAEHAGKSKGTVVTLEWSPYNSTAAERKTFDAGRQSMNQGWGGTFDNLAEYVKKME